MTKSGVGRIIALGHAGILKVSGETDALLMDQDDYPPEFIPAALENFKAYKHFERLQ
jgi:putative NADH-flavin reductase